MIALHKASNTYYIHKDIPSKSKQQGTWLFFVGHQIHKDDLTYINTLGTQLELQVDTLYRQQLSTAHSACHLVSLALNASTSTYWTKQVTKDSLHHHNLNQIAIFQSSILPNLAQDTYRIGKSLRKMRFDTPTFLNDVQNGTLQEKINQLVTLWLEKKIRLNITPNTSYLQTKRTWHAHIHQVGTATIPCGGTHLSNFDQIASIHTTIKLQDTSSQHKKGTYVTLISKPIWK